MIDELTRRDFLKRAGFAVAGIAGAASWTSAQDQEEPKEKEPEEEKPAEDPELDDLFGSDDEETRACPQCGALMYRQGNTWTCETCGYSYVE